ncbi:MAG: reverse transcriptase domain-containing protein, partial [bacterium]
MPEETVVIEMVEKPEYKWREIPESNGVFDWAASVRWVLRGYQDEREDMVTYAETPDRSCLNMLLSYAAAKKLPIRRGDITRAYLNANRKNAILVKTTRSMQKAGLSLYMWAKKNIYGAKDAARVFEEWINELLEELGWNKCNVAQSMYKITGYSSSMLGVRHSDDLAAIGPDAQEVMEALSSKVKMGPITKITEGRFLGCEFMRLDAKTFMSSDTGQLLVKTCDLK